MGPIRALGIYLWNLHSGGKLHIHGAVTEKYPRVIVQILAVWLANDRFLGNHSEGNSTLCSYLKINLRKSDMYSQSECKEVDTVWGKK